MLSADGEAREGEAKEGEAKEFITAVVLCRDGEAGNVEINAGPRPYMMGSG
jgi:hypothetical protein